MWETYRMLGEQREQELVREAARLQRRGTGRRGERRSQARGKLLLVALALAAVAALVAAPFLNAAPSGDARLEIGYSLRLFGAGIGPGGTAGTFVASGAMQDSGSVTGQSTVTPFGNGDRARLAGTSTLVGRLGTITTRFSGIAGPVGGVHTAARGTFRIIGGTGAYAGLHGHGTFLTVADFSSNQAVRTDDGEASDGGEGD